MSKDSLAMMPWFPRDFIAATLGWRLLERALYRCLLDAQWELGDLPADHIELALIAGATEEEFAKAWTRVSTKFQANASGRLFNSRLEEHRAKALKIRDKRIAAGRSGGKASVRSRQANDEANSEATYKANAVANVNHPSPSPSPESKSCVVVGEAGAMAGELRRAGVTVTSDHPTLLAWVRDGITLPRAMEAVEVARRTKGPTANIPANYLDTILREPARPPPARPQRAKGAYERLMEANGGE